MKTNKIKPAQLIQELVISKKLLAQSQKVAKLGYYVFDIVNDNWTSSKELNNIFGINKNYKKTFNSWLALIHPDFRSLLQQYFTAEIVTKKKKFDIEYKIVHLKTGKEKWVHGLGNLKFDKNQHPIEMFGVIQDITEHKKAENTLKQSEEKFKSIFHSLKKTAVIVINEKGTIIEWNKGAEQIFGYQKKEIQLKKLTTLMPAKYRKMHDKGFNKSVKNGHLTHTGSAVEVYGLTKNKKEIPLEMTLGSWKQGKEMFFSAIILDISKRKKIEKDLQQAKSIIEDVDSIVFLTNDKGEIIFCSPAIKKITGYNVTEVLGQKWWKISFINQHESNRIKKDLIAYAKGKLNIKSDTHPRQVKCKNGQIKWVEWYNTKGGDNNIISIGHDITKKMEVEQQLQFTMTNLEKLVRLRTKELEKTNKDLLVSLNKEKELNELKSRFIAVASHQFRTPITVIKTDISLINMYVDGCDYQLKKKLSKVTTRIQSEIDRMTELMNDVLVLGKVNAKSITPNYKPTDVVAIAEDIANKHNEIQEDKRKIKLVVSGKKRNLHLDGHLFGHAISNLISNAFKYSVGKPPPKLMIKFEEKQVKITVKDYGIGIPAKEIKQLFQTFYRASNVNNFSGTGLGIAIAKEYTELNKGEISVTSALHKGSLFSIVFK